MADFYQLTDEPEAAAETVEELVASEVENCGGDEGYFTLGTWEVVQPWKRMPLIEVRRTKNPAGEIIIEKKGHASTPAGETIKAATGTVGRLVDRLLQQDPHAQVRFTTGETDMELELLSVYSDDKGKVWIDVGVE